MDIIFNIPTIIIPIIAIFVSGYYGYPYAKNKIGSYVVNQLMKKLNTGQSISGGSPEAITFTQLGNSALISFNHGGKNHNVCVPYDRNKGRKMLRTEVFLISNNDRTNITHKPSIPYLLSAKDMGGEKIIVTKDDVTIREYKEDEVPNYLE